MTFSPLGRLVEILPSLAAFHSPSSPVYRFLAEAAANDAHGRFGPDGETPSSLPPFGEVVFPFHKMGAIDSTDLFGLDELILFAFYWTQRGRYRKALDVGANLGLHSILLDRCGYTVRCYEPDPKHFGILERNLELNQATRVTAHNEAVSIEDGEAEFIRVLGNTTSSHLAGSKPSPYGELERFNVKVSAIRPLMQWADLVKLDVEGHEANLVCATSADDWANTDMVLEVGSPQNADRIFRHCRASGVRMFAQKAGWSEVDSVDAMPSSYRDGSLFASAQHEGPWLVIP